MKPAPIVLFAYNRLDHTRRTLEALRANELAAASDVVVFSDGPRSATDAPEVDRVRDYLRTVDGFRSVRIVERLENLGLANSIIDGVTQMCRERGRIIVMEDDLVTSPFFLRYMNEALELYEGDQEVISVHGYVYPVSDPLPETFFLRGADCWGWATWQRGWTLFNPDGNILLEELEQRQLTHAFDLEGAYGYTDMLRGQCAGKNDSWAIRWYASAFLRNRLTLYPGISLVENIGQDGSGTHCGTSDQFNTALAQLPIRVQRQPLAENPNARLAFSGFLRTDPTRSWSLKLRSIFRRSAKTRDL